MTGRALTRAAALALAGPALGLLPVVTGVAVAAAPERETTVQFHELEDAFAELDEFGPFAECDGFIVLNEFTVTRDFTRFATREIRHFSYTGWLYRVDVNDSSEPPTYTVGDRVAYDGRATRIAQYPSGDPTEVSSITFSGRPSSIRTEDGQPIHMGVGRLVLDFTSGELVVISHGKDDPTAICDVLA